jgi:hypothetical protein
MVCFLYFWLFGSRFITAGVFPSFAREPLHLVSVWLRRVWSLFACHGVVVHHSGKTAFPRRSSPHRPVILIKNPHSPMLEVSLRFSFGASRAQHQNQRPGIAPPAGMVA